MTKTCASGTGAQRGHRAGQLGRHWLALAIALSAVGGCMPHKSPPVVDYGRAYTDASLQLVAAAGDAQPQVRTKAIEALAEMRSERMGPIILEALRDPSGPVRFAAAMAAGDTRYSPAKPLLLEMAKDDQTPPKMMAALAYALHQLGDDTYTTRLAKMLFNQDKWVRCTVAMVLGRMHEPSAKELLLALRFEDHDPVVQLAANEALAELNDERSATLLEAFIRSQFLEDRIIAIQTVGRLGNRRSSAALERVLSDAKQDPLVRAAAAGALAMMGDYRGYDYAVSAIQQPEKLLRDQRGPDATILPTEVGNLRSLAALALGKMKDRRGVPYLEPYIFATDGTVRVAADKAVLELLPEYQYRPGQDVTHPGRRPAGLEPATPPAVQPLPVRPPAVQPLTTQPAPITAVQPSATQPVQPPAVEPATPETATQPATPPAVEIKPPAAATEPTVRPSATQPGERPWWEKPESATKPAPAVQPGAESATQPAATEPAEATTRPVEQLLETRTKPKLKTAGAKD